MKTIFKIALCLSVVTLAGSCVLDRIDSQPAVAPSLKCDALESYTIQASKPQDVAFKVSATTPWSITGFENADWVEVTPASSAVSSLSEDIRVKTSVNPGFDDRSVTLTVKGENTDITYSIKLTQLRSGKLTVAPIEEIDVFPIAGGSKTFQLEANMDWTVSAADSWLSFTPASGSSDGSLKTFTVTAKAEANNSISRSTLVSVTAGDEKYEFTVHQQGQSLEFQTDAGSLEIDRRGGDLVIGVNATMDWTAECDNPAFTVSKLGSDKLQVTAGWNSIFIPRKAKLTLKPADSSYGDVSRSIELVQDINFTFSGNCEVLYDGSVKISSDVVSKVSTIDDLRYVSIVIKMGQVAFGDKGRMWCAVNADGCNIYSQIGLGDNIRVRQDGELTVTHKPGGDPVSTYKNVSISGIDKAALNAMTEYRFEVLPQLTADPDYQGVWWHVVNFWYNGTLNTTLNYRSVFADNPAAAGKYWFGVDKATTDGTWYIVKSCDITVLKDN